MEYTKIVILDADYDRCVLGLLTVKGKTAEEVEKIIEDVKQNVDYWTWEDILERFRELEDNEELEFSWEDNINSVAI